MKASAGALVSLLSGVFVIGAFFPEMSFVSALVALMIGYFIVPLFLGENKEGRHFARRLNQMFVGGLLATILPIWLLLLALAVGIFLSLIPAAITLMSAAERRGEPPLSLRRALAKVVGMEDLLDGFGAFVYRAVIYWLYITNHKFDVWRAGRKLEHLTPYKWRFRWLLLVHDLSKYSPSEFFAFGQWNYGYNGKGWKTAPADLDATDVEGLDEKLEISRERERRERDFNRALLNHYQRNPHHWENWLLPQGALGTLPLRIPEIYLVEMAADWLAMGAKQGRTTAVPWYRANRERIVMHPVSRETLEGFIGYAPEYDEAIHEGGEERDHDAN